MSKLSLPSQILQSKWRYTGKSICVTSYSGILEFPMRICNVVPKKFNIVGFLPARQIPRESINNNLHGGKLGSYTYLQI